MSDGEEWKDEPEPETPLFFGKGLFDWMKPLTPEQVAANDKARDEELAKGAAYHAVEMPPLGANEGCVKCRHNRVKVRFYDGGTGAWCPNNVQRADHLHVTCKRCHFMWCRRTLGDTR
jgi:predicted nucleic-acid-binding Zn-ribbon protein